MTAILNLLAQLFAALFKRAPQPPKPLDLAGRLIAAMVRKNYPVTRAPGELNIIYVRGMDPDGTPNGAPPDKWCSLRCVVAFDGDAPKMMGIWQATVDPGFYYGRDHIINAHGAAHIVPGYYEAWQVGFHRDDKNRPALIQTGGPVSVYRDKNRDFQFDGDAIETGYFGINQHDGQDGGPDSIGAHSAGCLVVASRAKHGEFMAMITRDPRYRANPRVIFGTAIFRADEVV